VQVYPFAICQNGEKEVHSNAALLSEEGVTSKTMVSECNKKRRCVKNDHPAVVSSTSLSLCWRKGAGAIYVAC
jgi:hypothetical protein